MIYRHNFCDGYFKEYSAVSNGRTVGNEKDKKNKKNKKNENKYNLRTYVSRRYVEEWVAFSDFLSVKNFMEQIDTDQEILAICADNPVVLLRDLDLSQITHRDNPTVLKIMRYAIGDYLYTRLREYEYDLTAELKTSMSAI